MVFGIQTAGAGRACRPQFNGVTALFDQAVGHRVGLLNFALYDCSRRTAYHGREAPLRTSPPGQLAL